MGTCSFLCKARLRTCRNGSVFPVLTYLWHKESLSSARLWNVTSAAIKDGSEAPQPVRLRTPAASPSACAHPHLPCQAGCTFHGGAQVEVFLTANGYRRGIMPFALYHQTYNRIKLGFWLFAACSFPMKTFVPEQNFSVWLGWDYQFNCWWPFSLIQKV